MIQVPQSRNPSSHPVTQRTEMIISSLLHCIFQYIQAEALQMQLPYYFDHQARMLSVRSAGNLPEHTRAAVTGLVYYGGVRQHAALSLPEDSKVRHPQHPPQPAATVPRCGACATGSTGEPCRAGSALRRAWRQAWRQAQTSCDLPISLSRLATYIPTEFDF